MSAATERDTSEEAGRATVCKAEEIVHGTLVGRKVRGTRVPFYRVRQFWPMLGDECR
jgi:hypothetical protein